MLWQLAHRHRRILSRLLLLVAASFAFSYALVPMYTLVCKAAGLNGRWFGQREMAAKAGEVDSTREVTVEFMATVNGNLPFQFRALLSHIVLHPGEDKTVYFFAENKSGREITVQAIPSIAPGLAAQYVRKTECFCFTQQHFKIGERVDMPVVFRLDPALPTDVRVVTLSYTLFDATGFKPPTQSEPGVITRRIPV